MSDTWLEELSQGECIELLRANAIGRIAVIDEHAPYVFPINYRLINVDERPMIVLRTRAGNTIDRSEESVALEIDGFDPAHERGWSVLVRGSIRHVELAAGPMAELLSTDGWVHDGRTSVLVVDPLVITGRRLVHHVVQWAFHESAYL